MQLYFNRYQMHYIMWFIRCLVNTYVAHLIPYSIIMLYMHLPFHLNSGLSVNIFFMYMGPVRNIGERGLDWKWSDPQMFFLFKKIEIINIIIVPTSITCFTAVKDCFRTWNIASEIYIYHRDKGSIDRRRNSRN